VPAVAFFMPALVYLADAIGTQSETIAVRGLSLSHMSLRQLFAVEVRTGLLLGTVLSAIAFPLIVAAFGNLRLAAAVALALTLASTIASTLGLAMPALLQRLGADPAYGSGPIANIVQDVLTLAIYFGCVTLVVL
jgi:magnesium transporter